MGYKKNPSFYTDFKNVHLTFVKSAPKKVYPQKTIQNLKEKKERNLSIFRKSDFIKKILNFHLPFKIL
jgi:hypothetical protein